MKCFVYVAGFLAAAAVATPVEHHARYISSGQQASGQGSQSQSSMTASPWGMSQSQSSSSYAYQQSSQVVQSFQPVLGMLGQMQGLMASGGMTQTLAASYMSQLSSQLQPALLGMNSCGCFGSPTIGPMINNVFGQLSQVMSSFQSSFGAGFRGIVSPFQQLMPAFQSFVQQSQQSSSYSSFSQSVTPFMNMLSPYMSGVGGF